MPTRILVVDDHTIVRKGISMFLDTEPSVQIVGEAGDGQDAIQKASWLKPDVILIAHGAAMENPADAQYMLNHTSVDGIWTGSSTERIPIERAVLETAKEFAALKFPSNKS